MFVSLNESASQNMVYMWDNKHRARNCSTTVPLVFCATVNRTNSPATITAAVVVLPVPIVAIGVFIRRRRRRVRYKRVSLFLVCCSMSG